MSEFRNTHGPDARARGRAARSNRAGRYERLDRDAEHDGWDIPEAETTLRTELTIERPRSIITRNTSPDVGFDRSINPYRGCEHGCIYCFARPTHAWLGLSPGLDFETRLVVRPDAAKVLERELGRPSYEVAPIAIGTNTDPYQPAEKEWRVMRRVLEVLRHWKHPVTIVTKGSLIERDIDILSEMAREGLASVGVSVTTLDPDVSRRMEPRVPPPARRLKTIRALAGAGIPVRAMIAPVIPALTDHELEAIVAATAEAGASAASYILLRLPREVSPLFREWVEHAYPDRASRIMSRVREMRGGKDYDAEWGSRMKGEGAFADLLRHRFAIACRRSGLGGSMPALRTDLFRRPLRRGDQLDLF